MQRSLSVRAETQAPKFKSRLRVNPAVHLCSGDLVGAFVEHAVKFEDTPALSLRPTTLENRPSAAKWVAEKITELATYCDTTGNTERPLILPIPGIALADAETIDAAVHAAGQTRLCHQEISFELTDAALCAAPAYAEAFIKAARKLGFRVSIDARTSHDASLSPTTWLMIDTLRLRTNDLETQPSLDSKVEIAASAGVAIVAENPFWREGEYLARLGIDYGLSPRTDA